MQLRQAHMLNSLRSADDFIDTNGDALGGVVNSSMRTMLRDSITELSGHASEQSGNTLEARGATKKHLADRTMLLHDCMAPIASIARVELASTPEIEPLRMPKARTNVEQLVAAANGMAKAAARHSQVFIDAGLPANFVTTLESMAQALLESQQARKASIGLAAAATKRLGVRLADGRRVVYALDTLVRTALKDNPTLLASWIQVKRVQQVRSISPAVPAVTTPAAAAA